MLNDAIKVEDDTEEAEETEIKKKLPSNIIIRNIK